MLLSKRFDRITTMNKKEEIILLREKGLAYREIGSIFGISRQRVYQIATGYISKNRIIPVTQLKTLVKRKREYLNLPENPIKQGARDRVREWVRIRDNRTCQKCSRKWNQGERRFDVHHLDEKKDGKSRSGMIHRWDTKHMNRLITLCHRCHFGLDITRNKMRKPHDSFTRSI